MKKFYAERDGGRPYILNESQTDRVAEMTDVDLKAWNDAQLMAAAGDMAEELRASIHFLEKFYDQLGHVDDTKKLLGEQIESCKKALKKAGVRHA